jgi:arylsulfatase A-like enzyme
LRRDTEVDWSGNGTYGTYLFTSEAEQVVANHNTTDPLFLYLTFQNNHVPLQVPDVYLPLCSHIDDSERQIYCAMGAAMDEAIGNVTRAFKNAGMWDDTLLIFTTDNGGWPFHGGNNWPLRGGKFTVWEGGVRGTSFVYGNILPRKGVVCNELMHITDWVPTLANLVGSNVTSPHPLDGYDMWESITTNAPSPRTEVLLNIDPIDVTAGLRVGNWKIVVGNQAYNDWYPLPNNTNSSQQSSAINVMSLYNISADPNERDDLLLRYPDVVKDLLAKITEYEKGSVLPQDRLPDSRADPANFGGAWTPWLG